MTDHSYTTTFAIDQSPQDAFAAINNVRGWWSEDIAGNTDRVGEVFDYHFKDAHRCRIKVTELVPGKTVGWRVLENYFSFTKDTTEWIGTDVVFAISRRGRQTEIRFTHVGLVPEVECFDDCSNAWGSYINGSLKTFIITAQPA